MKKKFINECHVEGYLYEHNLEVKVTGQTSKNPGTEYIRGSIGIATDEAMTNIVPVYYTYVVPKAFSGNPYPVLSGILNGTYGTVMGQGAANAAKVRVDCSLNLNEFPTERDGKEEFVSVKRNEGGFIHVVDTLIEDESKRNTFKVDMVITNVVHVDENPDTDSPEKAIVKGCIFDFRKALLPVEFTATNPGAIAYFEGLDASKHNPVFTNLWGQQVSTVTVKKLVTEAAFGEDQVREVKNTKKDFVITGSMRTTYEWDSEDSITAEEFAKMCSDRATHVATLKQQRDEYKATKAASATPAPGGFNF